ncbi:DUF2127 domain-containing protein [Uliginosibacterium sp. H3]|uniref:DUF2127 domain-containing protein n=1 Tax=Uliginosibacterium silvisoli TaxID=3114758 RepID=A0ABU6K679_9RHOO|nr:DUF2127 domain-containing protein [Uliginosibacterium sp. H3]
MSQNEPSPIASSPHPVAARRTLRAIAVFEAIKGFAALIAIIGVVDLMHHDVRHLAEALIGRFRLSPDGRYSSIILHYADMLPGANVQALMWLAAGYILLRFMEAYGLWRDKAWAEWLGALSGGLYVPLEIHHFMQRASLVNGLVLLANVIVVAFLAMQLRRRHRLVQRGFGARRPSDLP